MGGGFYDEDVATQARSTNTDVFNYRGYGTTAAEAAGRRQVHPELNPFGKIRECMNETPIVVAMDVTRSRGDDSRIIYAKLPLFIGQIIMKGYVPGPAISFAAIGDASAGDQAPLQVGQFEADNRLDKVLSNIWLEEGGGGTGQESYELAAYFYARHSKLACLENDRKGYFFFLGDEGFYPKVDRGQIMSVLGRDVPESIDSADVFRELQERFHTYFIYPQKSMSDRKKDIDAEIKQRVEAAGGRYEGVDVRASLIWDNRNDLDLHVITPAGEHIYYGNKRASCGGWLDVDMNVRGDTTKPVENVQWRKGTAPAGRYRVYVQNYRFHETDQAPTKFRVEVEVNGVMKRFEGVIAQRGETGPASDVPVHDFYFDPNARPADQSGKPADDGMYANYSDEVIMKQWSSVLPAGHILRIEDPKAIIDVMLGVLAIAGGGKDLEGYIADMKSRDQTDLRVDQAARTLGDLAAAVRLSRAVVDVDVPPGSPPAGGATGPRRGAGARRL